MNLNLTWPLWAATVLYMFQALNYYKVGQHGHAVAFGGYAVANLGFIWALTNGA